MKYGTEKRTVPNILTKVIITHIPTNVELSKNIDILSHLDEPTETFSCAPQSVSDIQLAYANTNNATSDEHWAPNMVNDLKVQFHLSFLVNGFL